MIARPPARWASVAALPLLACAPQTRQAHQQPVQVEAVAPAEGEPAEGPAPADPVPRTESEDACRALAARFPPANDHTVAIHLRDDGTCLDELVVDTEVALARAARAAADRGVSDAALYVEPEVSYARVVQVMDVLREAGITNLVLGNAAER